MSNIMPTERNVTATGAGTGDDVIDWGGGLATVAVIGTFGGTVITFEYSPDNGTTFIPMVDSAGAVREFVAADVDNFQVGAGKIRHNATGGAGIDLTIVYRNL